MRREDFVFTIGYDGSTAIIDGKARKRYGKLTARQLTEQGLCRAAFCAALFDDDGPALDAILQSYGGEQRVAYTGRDDLKRLYGVTAVPDDIKRVKVL